MPGTPLPTPLDTGFGAPWIRPAHGKIALAIWFTAATTLATPAMVLAIALVATFTPPMTIRCAASTAALAPIERMSATPLTTSPSRPLPKSRSIVARSVSMRPIDAKKASI